MVASIIFATGSLAHAALSVCWSKAALTALSVPAALLAPTTPDGAPRPRRLSAPKKPVEIQMWAVPPPPTIKAATLATVSEGAEGGEGEVVVEEEEAVEEIKVPPPPPAVCVKRVSWAAPVAAPPPCAPSSPCASSSSSSSDEACWATPKLTASDPAVLACADDVFDAALALGASALVADHVVGAFFNGVECGAMSAPQAADTAVRMARALIKEEAIMDAAERAGRDRRTAVAVANGAAVGGWAGLAAAAHAGGGAASASASASASSLLGWATASPQNWAAFTAGAQATGLVAVVGVAAVAAAVAVTGVAVGALGALAVSRAARRARAAAAARAPLLPDPRPTSAGAFLPPPHPSAFAGGIQRVYIADDSVDGMPLSAPAPGSAIWTEVVGAWDAICEGADDAAAMWDAFGVPGVFADDGDEYVPPPPPPMPFIPGAAVLPGRGGPRRFVQ